jgi:pimeloyl-ACP methyl ester carboxylesterase
MSQEKTISVGNIPVTYKTAGQSSFLPGNSARQRTPLLFLHGWGSSSDSWVSVQSMLADKGYQVVVPDLPGFGKTPAPGEVWGVEEYARFVYDFAEAIDLEKFVLVGHSFGGQIAIQFATVYPEKIDKLVLVAAAGVRRTPGVFKKLVATVAKIVSFTLYLVPFEDLRSNIKSAAYMFIRRRDYVRTQGIMRDVFKKVITQDLTVKFSKITMPTLVIWGDKDELTPVQDAYLMQECISNVQLKIIEGGKHALNFQMPEKLGTIIVSFLR